MKKSFKITTFFAIICLAFLFSCAGKKNAATEAQKNKGKDAMTEEKVASEQQAKEAQEARLREEEAAKSKSSGSLEALERIYFDFDDANLREDARNTLKKNAEILKQNTNANIVAEGHCDERGSEEYNLALGQRRSESIKKYLVTLGINSQKLSTISYGEEKPLVQGHNEDAWTKNRRGELVVKQ